MHWLNAYKKLGHRFKRRYFVTSYFLVWLFLLKLTFSKRGSKRRPGTLLIVRFDLIGDYVLFRNFLSALRNSDFKNFHITLCGNAVYKNLAESLDGTIIDEFIWIDRSRFLKDKAYHFAVLRELNNAAFEIAFQPTFSREIYGDLLIYASQAKQRIGVDGDCANQTKARRQITDGFYTELIKVDSTPKFEFFRNKEIVEKVIKQDVALAKPKIVLSDEGNDFKLNENYAVLVVGASHPRKLWRGYHDIIKHVVDRCRLKIVFVGHGKKDGDAINEVLQKSSLTNYTNLCDKTTLIELAQVLNSARLVVSNDTAAVHLAAALGTPTVCIALGSHAYRFNNYPLEMGVNICFLFPEEVESRIRDGNFSDYQSPYSSELDINSISPDRVEKAIDEVMTVG